MLLVYTADLHGNIAGYRQLLELAAQRNAQAVIVGGDLLPPDIKIATAIQNQRAFIQNSLRPLLMEFHTAHPDIAVYLLPGNDDWAAAIAALDDLEQEGLVHPLHQRVFALADDLWLAGYACVPITPFSIKDYERHDGGDLPSYSFAMAYTSASGQPEKASVATMLRRPTIAEDLEALARQSNPARTIYVSHAPPHDTGLDLMRNKHAGSRSLRVFIEQHQPLLTLHGHIHEAPQVSHRYAERLGQTWCVNPGHDRLVFYAVTFDTDDLAGTLWHTVYGSIGSIQ
ncbi:MAG: metallophosphoesterase [Chloroflexaceae bacterium]